MLVNHVNDPVQQHLNQRGLFAKRVVSPLSQDTVSIQIERCVNRDFDSLIALHVAFSLSDEFFKRPITNGRVKKIRTVQMIATSAAIAAISSLLGNALLSFLTPDKLGQRDSPQCSNPDSVTIRQRLKAPVQINAEPDTNHLGFCTFPAFPASILVVFRCNHDKSNI